MAWYNCNTAIAKFNAAQIEKTKADIVDFYSNVGNILIPEAKVSITPVQSGSGDPSPSNPRPISGWNSVKVSATGKNLLNFADVTYSTWAGSNADLLAFFNSLPSGTYTFSYKFKVTSLNDTSGMYGVFVSNSNASANIVLRDNYSNVSANTEYSYSKTFTIAPENVGNFTAVYFYCGRANPVDTVAFYMFMVEIGSTATTYEPYNGQTATIALPHTVYGAEHDVLSGVGSETYGMVDLGSLTWTKRASSDDIFYCSPPNMATVVEPPYTNRQKGAICSHYPNSSGFAISDAMDDKSWLRGSNMFYLKNSAFTNYTTAQVKEAMSGVQLCYELYTPTTYQATPAQLQARNGTNNVWADAGETSLKYYEIRRTTT